MLIHVSIPLPSFPQAAADAELSDAQRQELSAAAVTQHTGFNAAARQEHLRERQDLAKAHQEEEEAARKFREQIQVRGGWMVG